MHLDVMSDADYDCAVASVVDKLKIQYIPLKIFHMHLQL